MLAFHFGPADRRLFGLFHPAQSARHQRQAVLLCNPFGQEAVRVHRMYRVLAERLARNGSDVLRFDFFGTGDSAGDDAQGELEGWVTDVATASRELERRAGAARLVWLGARLGASVAALGAARAGRVPDALVMWEPVVDGAAYLRTLAHGTVAAFENSFSITDPAWRQTLASLPLLRDGEAIGFEAGARLQEQLLGLTPDSFIAPRLKRAAVVRADASPALDAMLQRWRAVGIPIEESVQPHDFDWVAEEALNTALVPHEIVKRLDELAGVAR